MITTIVCCFCVVCTAVVATYSTAARAPCILFSFAFSSGSLLVSAVYYAIIKMTLLAMGTVLEMKKGRISIHANRRRFQRVPLNNNAPSVPQQEAGQRQKNDEEEMDNESFSSWSFSDNDDEEDSENPDETVIHLEEPLPRQQQPSQVERFSALKVWTNVYGLAVGVFCMVHSLTLPSELGNTVFCLCLWVEGSLELFKPRSKKKCEASMACISTMLLVAIGMKSSGSFVSGRLDLPVTASDYSSIVVPIVGVSAIRNMRRTNNIRATLELSAPVCLMASLLCFLVCIFVSFSQPSSSSCMVDHLWDLDPVFYKHYINGTATATPNHTWMFLRHEPILSMVAIPFPLICSVVAVVACSQTSHVLVIHCFCFVCVYSQSSLYYT
jgi:hypothetical protein